MLKNHFRVTGSGKLSADGAKRVWIINNNDWHSSSNRPIRTLVDTDDGIKNVVNVFIFHSKQTDIDDIRAVRAQVKRSVIKQNKWYSKHVRGCSNKYIIDELYYLGQFVKLKKGREKEFELIQAAI